MTTGGRKALFWAVPCALLIAAFVARARTVPPRDADLAGESVDSLIARMAGHEDSAVDAQNELQRRIRAGKAEALAVWKRALDSPSHSTRYLAVDSLAQIESPESAGLLADSLRDVSSKVRERAVEGLGSFPAELALPPLLSALADPDSALRESAIVGIKRLNDRRSVPMLVRAVHDKDRQVSSPASHALSKLTGQPWKGSVRDGQAKLASVAAKWDAWWHENRAAWPGDHQGIRSILPDHPKLPAPGFDVAGVNGQRIRLADFKGKVVLLNFWATWCPPCREEMPSLAALAREYASRGLEVVGLAVEDKEPAEIAKFAREKQVSYRLGVADEAVRDAYDHVHEIPVTALIDRQGIVRYRWEGARERDSFETLVKLVLNEPPVPPNWR